MAVMVIVAVVFGAIALAHVNRRQAVIRLGYDLGTATDQLRTQRETNRQLSLEKATLTRPERVRAMAQGMGMIQPAPSQVRVIRPTEPVATNEIREASE